VHIFSIHFIDKRLITTTTKDGVPKAFKITMNELFLVFLNMK